MAQPLPHHDHVKILINRIKKITPSQGQKRKQGTSPTPKPTPTPHFNNLEDTLTKLSQNAAKINKRPDWIPAATAGFICMKTVKEVSSALYPEPNSAVRLSPSNVDQLLTAIFEFADDVTRTPGMNNNPKVNSDVQNNDTNTHKLEQPLEQNQMNTGIPSPKPGAQSNDKDKINQDSKESSQTTATEMTREVLIKALAEGITAKTGGAIPPEVSESFLKEGANKAEQQGPSMKMGM